MKWPVLISLLFLTLLTVLQPEYAQGNQDIKLLGSAAFRGSFAALPQWKRVLSKADGQIRTLNTCTTGCPAGASSWKKILSDARELEPMKQLKLINTFFNKWPYGLDIDIYGVADWWATPQEFLKKSGDCEDYAIIKYFALRQLGFAAENLRIVALKDRIRGLGHAVLAVFIHNEAYILDNLSNLVISHTRYTHYVPQYSVNEEYRWTHIPIAKP